MKQSRREFFKLASAVAAGAILSPELFAGLKFQRTGLILSAFSLSVCNFLIMNSLEKPLLLLALKGQNCPSEKGSCSS